jgi:hypothetical protein
MVDQIPFGREVSEAGSSPGVPADLPSILQVSKYSLPKIETNNTIGKYRDCQQTTNAGDRTYMYTLYSSIGRKTEISFYSR